MSDKDWLQNLKVGDKVFVFDDNHREYVRDSNGNSSGGPIYRKHFVETTITGETPRSWITARRPDLKYSKKDGQGLYNAEQVDEAVYVHDHAHKIADRVYRVDYKTLKAIAKLIGYEETK